MIVTKHRYSAFIGTDLDMLLRARGVKSLLVTGVGTGMCVFHTLTVGFMLDYYITLVEDCAATTYGRGAHDEAVALVKKHYGRIASSDEIIAHCRLHRKNSRAVGTADHSFSLHLLFGVATTPGPHAKQPSTETGNKIFPAAIKSLVSSLMLEYRKAGIVRCNDAGLFRSSFW